MRSSRLRVARFAESPSTLQGRILAWYTTDPATPSIQAPSSYSAVIGGAAENRRCLVTTPFLRFAKIADARFVVRQAAPLLTSREREEQLELRNTYNYSRCVFLQSWIIWPALSEQQDGIHGNLVMDEKGRHITDR